MRSESVDRVKWPADLIENICQLAKGPAGLILKDAIQDWLDGHKQSLRAGRHPPLPYPADQSDPYSPAPKQPLPMPGFGAGCAVLAAVHDQNCARCVALWPPPTAHDDPVGHALWKQLRYKVCEKPDPSYGRKILSDVQAELRPPGVLPSGEAETRAAKTQQAETLAGGALSGPPPVISDGPVAPDAFRWRGELIEGLQGVSWQLVNALWTADNRTLPIDKDLGRAVWADHQIDPGEDQIGAARTKANHFFLSHGIPFRVSKKSRTHISLIAEKPKESK